MKTVLLHANEVHVLDHVARLVLEGKVVAFPTDTVYGVGCDVWSETAIETLYSVKQRPHDMAIPVLVSSMRGIESIARIDECRIWLDSLSQSFWPGALTLVLPACARVPAVLLAGKNTVAVRMPDHPFALALIERLGGAMAATSANISGEPSPVDADQVMRSLGGRIPALVDGGRCQVGVASTIVDLTGSAPRVLRQGGLPFADLVRALPDVVRPE